MKRKYVFILCVLILVVFAAGIHVGSAIAQATARIQAELILQERALAEARARGMKTELFQMREEWMRMEANK